MKKITTEEIKAVKEAVRKADIESDRYRRLMRPDPEKMREPFSQFRNGRKV
jgi:NifB/MoaA-like Fe-S oxidoreductase